MEDKFKKLIELSTELNRYIVDNKLNVWLWIDDNNNHNELMCFDEEDYEIIKDLIKPKIIGIKSNDTSIENKKVLENSFHIDNLKIKYSKFIKIK